MQINWITEKRNLTDLKEWGKNPRTLTEKKFNKLKERIDKRGFHDILKVDRNNIVLSGNQRLKALKDLGIKEVDVKVPDRELTKEEMEAVALESNISDGEWDFDILANEFEESLLNEVDLSIGFEVIDPEDVKEDDFTPTEDAKYDIAKGDIYALGSHRVMCGDSSNIEDVERLVDNKVIEMVFTDPPYNVNYSVSVDKKRRKEWGGILNDNMTDENFTKFIEEFNASLFSVLKEGGSIYQCIDWKHYSQLETSFRKIFTHKASIIWNKNSFGPGTYYRTKYEIILFGCKGEKLNAWNAGRNEMDVWSEDREKLSNYIHPTQKPVSLPARAIQNSTDSGQNVLDLFGGSGSTLVACEQLNRKCYMMELDPKYCSVIIERWEKLTGKAAEKLS